MTRTETSPPVAWVIGASSGIGEGIAIRLAAQGYLVCASARRRERLDALCARVDGIVACPLDCSDHGAIHETAAEIIKICGRIDLVVFAAVLTDQKEDGAEGLEKAIRVGTLACAHVVDAVLPHMRAQNQGQIAIIGSPVGFRALPGAKRYGIDKAALHYFAESLKIELLETPIKVQLVLPGFVKTPLTENNKFPMPFLMELDDAINRIMRGLTKPRKFIIAFPKRLIWPVRLLGLLPNNIYFNLMRRIATPKK